MFEDTMALVIDLKNSPSRKTKVKALMMMSFKLDIILVARSIYLKVDSTTDPSKMK